MAAKKKSAHRDVCAEIQAESLRETGVTPPPHPLADLLKKKKGQRCECDNTHARSGTVCRCCWDRGVRHTAAVRVEDHGSLAMFRPLNDAGKEWLEENTDGQWFGGALAVEPRFAGGLVAGLRDGGVEVRS